MKLLWENLPEMILEPLIEESTTGGGKKYFLYGPSIVAEVKNKNGRIYRSNVIEREVMKLQQRINEKKAGGELNHPQSPEVNPERVSHYITELKRDGNVWYSKVKVASTPMGMIVRNIMDDNQMTIGNSTRGLGTVGRDGYVSEDFNLITLDLVGSPSGPGCYLDPIMEAKDWIIKEDGSISEQYEKLEKKLDKLPKRDVEMYLGKAIGAFLRSLK